MSEPMRSGPPRRPVLAPSGAGLFPARGGGFLLGWILFILLAPFYVYDSGDPQPADFLMALLILLLFTTYFVRIPVHRDLLMFGYMFLFYVAATNLYWWYLFQESMFYLSALYYFYNALIFMLVISLFKKHGELFRAVTRWALLAALMIECAVVLFAPGAGARETGTFNNPNQLGYWSLLAAGCYLVLQGRERLGLVDLLVLATAGYLAMISLSRGAMVAYVILLGTALVCQRVDGRWALVLAVALAFAAVVVVVEPDLAEHLGQSMVDDIRTRLQRGNALEVRGYDRIWLYPEYLIFGAGEGAYHRFPPSPAFELHSTLGTVLFSYGVIGFALFIGWLVVVFRKAEARCLLYFSAPILYGMTHQGLRASMLWVFLGLVFGMSYYYYASRAGGARAAVSRPLAPGAAARGISR